MNLPLLETNPLLAFAIRLGTIVLVVILGRVLAGASRQNLKVFLVRGGLTESFVTLFSSLAYYIILLLMGALVLALLGVPTSMIASLLVGVLVVLGLAFQETLGNISAAVIFLLFEPFTVGDTIETGEIIGTVKEIQLFNTLIITGENKLAIVPNGKIQDEPIINYSQLGILRANMSFSISYADDLQLAKQILLEMLATDERMLEEPAPSVVVENLGKSSVDLAIRSYVRFDDYWDVQSEMKEQVKIRFDEVGITIPFPQQDIRLFPIN